MFVIDNKFPYPVLRPLTMGDCISAVRGDEEAPVEAHLLMVDYPLFAACITYGCYISPLSAEDYETFEVAATKKSADVVFLAEEDVADKPFISQQPT